MPADSVSRMDSNGSSNGKVTSNTEFILSSSPGASSLRERTDSESSDKLAKFILPSADGSPPRVLTINEISDVVKNIQNMTLVHEIVLNPDFKLQPYEPPENSLERRIKEIMHKAFWDILREEINSTPPSYNQAIQLLSDIKECFPQILASSNKRALDHINEVLDESVIRQQAEKGTLDFKAYANFVLELMAKTCAPARDEEVAKLSQIEDVVDMFKGILDTMAVMKLDMANFLLDSARNDILVNSVEYEKEKFKEYLEYYKFGFPNTENWLKRIQGQNANSAQLSAEQIIIDAFLELLDCNESNEFPEVLCTDKERILKLGQRSRRLCVCASLISICSAVPIISQRTDNRIKLAKQIEIILQGVTTDKELSDTIHSIWEQIKSEINAYLQVENQDAMGSDAENLFKLQILQIAQSESQIRKLMWKRMQTYFRLSLKSRAGLPPPPPGYVDYKDELEAFTTAYKRVIGYNHSVFGEYFLKVLTNQRSSSEMETDNLNASAVQEVDKTE